MGRKAREKQLKRAGRLIEPWTPFEPAHWSALDLMRLGLTESPELYRNSRYTVQVRRIEAKLRSNDWPNGWPSMVHLSIKRNDREVIHDWRDLQRIKNELVGPENEAMELYPAESRLTDDANQYHLWVFEDARQRAPCGFTERMVSEGNTIGAKQRRFPLDAPRPAGLREVTKSEWTERLKDI